jgi:hypothetical protein
MVKENIKNFIKHSIKNEKTIKNDIHGPKEICHGFDYNTFRKAKGSLDYPANTRFSRSISATTYMLTKEWKQAVIESVLKGYPWLNLLQKKSEDEFESTGWPAAHYQHWSIFC